MYITITSIKLKNLWKFFSLSYFALKVRRQLSGEKGFLKFKGTGLGVWHFTMTAWESEEDLKRFARSGAHWEAMKQTSFLASEIYTYTYMSENLPGWKEAKVLLLANGKRMIFEKEAKFAGR